MSTLKVFLKLNALGFHITDTKGTTRVKDDYDIPARDTYKNRKHDHKPPT